MQIVLGAILVLQHIQAQLRARAVIPAAIDIQPNRYLDDVGLVSSGPFLL